MALIWQTRTEPEPTNLTWAGLGLIYNNILSKNKPGSSSYLGPVYKIWPESSLLNPAQIFYTGPRPDPDYYIIKEKKKFYNEKIEPD